MMGQSSDCCFFNDEKVIFCDMYVYFIPLCHLIRICVYFIFNFFLILRLSSGSSSDCLE